MQARYYDSVIGRFYSNDPVDALTFLNQGNVHGFNRYAYANNNPYKYIDPNGESASAAFTGHLQLEQNKQINHVKSKMSADEFKQVEQDAFDALTTAAALLPGGKIIDVAKITADLISGEVPVSDAMSLGASEVSGGAVDGIAEGVSPNSSGNKYVKAGKCVAEQVMGNIAGALSDSTDKMLNDKLNEKKDEE